ncbi:unnamed protein product [Fusarium graminearum]|nr:unnamed protein product [Fusarium graminearum]
MNRFTRREKDISSRQIFLVPVVGTDAMRLCLAASPLSALLSALEGMGFTATATADSWKLKT